MVLARANGAMRTLRHAMNSTDLSTLPEPDHAARDHSARVVAMVRAEVARSGGWITFADYMQLVLYAPGLGYYVAGARKFGGAGVFLGRV